MGTSVSNIFGPDPSELRLRRQQQLMAPITQATNPYERIGAALGTALGASLFDIQDPQLQKATNITSIFNDIMKDTDPTKSDYASKLETLATRLAEQGYGREAAMATMEANKAAIQLEELGIKRGSAAREARTKEQADIKFYTDNPDQATFELQRLAQIIEADPTNQTALDRYQKIAAAGQTGALARAEREEKESLGTAKDRALLAKYQKDLSDAQKFGPAERWDAETQAARDLLASYNIDATKPIKDQVKAGILYGPGGQTLIRAQQTALQRKTSEGGGPTAAPVPAIPQRAAPAPARVIDFGQLPK